MFIYVTPQWTNTQIVYTCTCISSIDSSWFLGAIQTKDQLFLCCGNSAADISTSHTFKWGPVGGRGFGHSVEFTDGKKREMLRPSYTLDLIRDDSQWGTSIKYCDVVISTWSHIDISWHEYSYGVRRSSAQVWMLWHGQNATEKMRGFGLNSP